MAVIDADAHVVETERPWESMGLCAHPPHAAHSMEGWAHNPKRAKTRKAAYNLVLELVGGDPAQEMPSAR